jgi:2-polyprenyl-3-methyl-5-hydroxy-6-metoxy-1,4-benzoquinol methylase
MPHHRRAPGVLEWRAPEGARVTTDSYVIRGGLEGRERLRVLARVMWPTTEALVARVGVRPDARCLDLGCGGGDVTVELARLVPEGFVVGADLDDTKLALARAEAEDAGLTNVEYRHEDVLDAPPGDERLDVVYIRFLLTHLTDPAAAVRRVRERVVPGGVVMIEDIDCRGHFCHPPSEAFDRYVALYSGAARSRGVDPDIGPRLPAFLLDAGFADVGMQVVQPAGYTGEVKLIAPLTLEAVANAVIGAGLATAEEIGGVVDELYAEARRDGVVQSLPRIVQAWGRLAA